MEYHAARLFGTATVRFDPAVKVEIPEIAENQRVFPVTVDARAVPGVRRVLLFADLNPIPVAVDFAPKAAAPYLATRIKLDQRTPVRAAVLTGDGVWHVSGAWIDAAGGGCSAPPVSRVRGDWSDHLGEMHGAAWRGRRRRDAPAGQPAPPDGHRPGREHPRLQHRTPDGGRLRRAGHWPTCRYSDRWPRTPPSP